MARAGAQAGGPLVGREDLRVLERLRLDSLDALLGGVGGRREGPGRTAGLEFADYRRYTPGDDVRRIDWTVYARLRELHVHTAPQEARVSLALMLDASASMGFGEPSKLRCARRLAALLGVAALLHADTVQVHALHDGDAVTGRLQDAGGSPRRLVEELEHLAVGRTTRLAAGVRRAHEQGAAADVAVLISDALVPAGELAQALRELARGARAAALVHVVDAAEAAAGPAGRVRLLDSETGREIELTVTDRLRARYAEQHALFLARTRRACRAQGVRYVALPTSVDPLELLLDRARSESLLRARSG